MNEAIKSRYVGAVPYFGVTPPNIPGIPTYGNIGFVGRLGGMSPVVGKGITNDNPFQQVDSPDFDRLGSFYSLGVPRVRLAGVPSEYVIRAYTDY
jgi:hypothetical protein